MYAGSCDVNSIVIVQYSYMYVQLTNKRAILQRVGRDPPIMLA